MADTAPIGGEVPPPRRSAGTIQSKRRKLRWPPERDFRVLSLDGGGIKGLYTAALLARVEDALGGRSIASHFDLIAGTSTGGIIALGLAAGLTAKDVLGLYLEHGKAIFPRKRRFGIFRPAFQAEALRRLLEPALADCRIGDARVRLCIPSCEARYGDVNVFKTSHHPDFKLDWKMPMIEVALATSAAPTVLPVHLFAGYFYADGGMWANNPAMVAVVDAMTCYDLQPEQIRMLSIGTGAPAPALTQRQLHAGGAINWILRGPLIESFMQYASANADGQAGLLIGRDRMIRLAPHGDDALIDMTDFEESKARLVPAGTRAADDALTAIADAFLRTDVEPPTFFYGNRASVVPPDFVT